MNNTYIYDGEFSSLIKLVIYLLNFKENPSNIKSEKDYIPSLLDEPVYLNIKKEKININKKILHFAYYTYLSTDKRKELIIYYFLKNYFIYGDNVIYRRNLNCVNNIRILLKKVSGEAHKMKGFLRFKKMKDFYYGEISPTNDVLPIIVNHFVRRLKNENFVIKDKNRNKYAVYDRKNIMFLSDDDIISLNLENNNDDFEDLWKTFFNTITIKERENKKVQMNFMPKKYWNDMLEMEDKI